MCYKRYRDIISGQFHISIACTTQSTFYFKRGISHFSIFFEIISFYSFYFSGFQTKRVHVLVTEGDTVKPVLSSHSKEDKRLVFKTDYGLMQVKRIAEYF